MRCAAIVVNYHCAEETLAAVASVCDADQAVETIVVDNSQEVEQARRLAERLPPSTRLLLPQRNLGFAAACNLAAATSQAEALKLLNPDARLFPGALARLRGVLGSDARLAAEVGAKLWDRLEPGFYLAWLERQGKLSWCAFEKP